MITIGHSQVYPARMKWMQALAKRAASECPKFRMVEVGSWVGESAILWARAAFERTTDVRVYCVDPWQPYDSLDVPEMQEALCDHRVFGTFLQNVDRAGLSLAIHPVVGTLREHWGSVVLWGPHALVYIDGDHAYTAVKQDLYDAARLLSDGGYLCGDDLERQLHEVPYSEAYAHRAKDGPLPYHAGVTLAVGEFFRREVSAYDGFWVMQKAGDDWREVVL